MDSTMASKMPERPPVERSPLIKSIPTSIEVRHVERSGNIRAKVNMHPSHFSVSLVRPSLMGN